MATQIIPNLWLGNIIDSRNSEFLKQIDVVINCSTNIPFYSKDTQNIRIRVEDNLEKEEIENMFKYLDNTADFLHKTLLENKAIFVHCYAGKQRSATVICAYLMKYLKLSYKDTTELMQTKRLVIFTPLPNFDVALKQFEEKIRT
jgi:atypical dual specificity phosphatase